MSNARVPSACEDVHRFNAELVAWLARTGPGATLGESHDSILTTVPIGEVVCELRGGSTREGVANYLERAARGDAPFYVVPSTKNVVHRVTLGEASDRIRGFYLYTPQAYSKPSLIAAADGTAFLRSEVYFKLLDAVALLHSRGHQRLRVITQLGGHGSLRWVFVVVLAENIATSTTGLPEWHSELFRYSSKDRFRVGDKEVGPHTSVSSLARLILRRATDDQGLGIDWAYAGWYREMLGEARRLGGIPIAYCSEYGFPHEAGWELGPGSGNAFPLPPAPVTGSRAGFSDVFPGEPVEDWDAPFPTDWVPVEFDPTKLSRFTGLVAGFDRVGGEFVGLWAMVGARALLRADRRWIPYDDAATLARYTQVSVSYRFIKSFDILAADKRRPDWSFARSMSVFSSP